MKKTIIVLAAIVLLQACTNSTSISSIGDSSSVKEDSIIIKGDTTKVVDSSSLKIIK